MTDARIFPADLADRMKDCAGHRYRPSNGSEGEIFMGVWCERCTKDAAHRKDPDNAAGCPIIVNAFAYNEDDERYPSEWQYGSDGQPICTAFDDKQPLTKTDKAYLAWLAERTPS